MTDMRAPGQLLECIAMRAEFVDGHAGTLDADATHQEASKILEAVTELRKRGDTPVRREDLRLMLGATNEGPEYRRDRPPRERDGGR